MYIVNINLWGLTCLLLPGTYAHFYKTPFKQFLIRRGKNKTAAAADIAAVTTVSTYAHKGEKTTRRVT